MASKIPVGSTITQTYGFAFGNFFNNLSATWIPQVLLFAAGYFIGPLYASSLTQIQRLPPGANAQNAAAALQNNLRVLGAALPFMSLVFLITFVCVSAIAAALTKDVLSPRQARSFVQFPFGAPAFRLMAAYLLAILALVVLYFGTILVAAIVGGLVGIVVSAGPSGRIVIGLVALVITAVVFCASIYVWVRLSFLITPAVVAEGRITLATGWRLTRGNFWRIIAVGLAVWLPVFVIYAVVLGTIMSTLGLPATHPGMTPAETAAWSQQINARVLGVVSSYRRIWFVTYPIAIAVSTVIYGLACGLSAFAYRALAPEPDGAAATFA